MIYFGYPLDIHGWKTKPETKPDRFRAPNPKIVDEKLPPKPKPLDPKTRGYPNQNRSVAILSTIALDLSLCKHNQWSAPPL
jgi:hypothetical protein